MSKLFGANLKRARQEKGLTTTECAKMLGISQPAWNFYELGSREPKLDVIVRMCELLDTTPNKLFGASFDQAESYTLPRSQDSIMCSIRELHKAAEKFFKASSLYMPAVEELCKKTKEFMEQGGEG